MFLLRPLLKLARIFLPPDLDWIADLAHDLLTAVPPMVKRLNSPRFAALSGEDKARKVVEEVARVLDAADDVPGWKSLPEHRRDALIGAVSEVSLFIIEVSDGRFSPSPIEIQNVKTRRAMPGRLLNVERDLPSAFKRLDIAGRDSD